MNLVETPDGPISTWSEIRGLTNAQDVTLTNGLGGLGFTDADAARKGIYDASNGAWIIDANWTAYDTAFSPEPARESMTFTTPAGCSVVRLYFARINGSRYAYENVAVLPSTEYVASFWHEVIDGQYRVGRLTLYTYADTLGASPDAQRGDLEAQESSNVVLSFIEIAHPKLPATQRYVTDVFDYVWGGETYRAISDIEIPLSDDRDSPPRLSGEIQNIDREIGRVLEEVPTRIKVTHTLLSSADFDLTANPRTEIGTASPLYTLSEFQVVSASWSDAVATVELILRDYGQVQFGYRATFDLLPGGAQ